MAVTPIIEQSPHISMWSPFNNGWFSHIYKHSSSSIGNPHINSWSPYINGRSPHINWHFIHINERSPHINRCPSSQCG